MARPVRLDLNDWDDLFLLLRTGFEGADLWYMRGWAVGAGMLGAPVPPPDEFKEMFEMGKLDSYDVFHDKNGKQLHPRKER